jgi:hypothetical protein
MSGIECLRGRFRQFSMEIFKRKTIWRQRMRRRDILKRHEGTTIYCKRIKGAVSRRRLAKLNGTKKRLKLMLHDWKRCSCLQCLKQSKDVMHNGGIINSISYITPNLINCWQTVFPSSRIFWMRSRTVTLPL